MQSDLIHKIYLNDITYPLLSIALDMVVGAIVILLTFIKKSYFQRKLHYVISGLSRITHILPIMVFKR